MLTSVTVFENPRVKVPDENSVSFKQSALPRGLVCFSIFETFLHTQRTEACRNGWLPTLLAQKGVVTFSRSEVFFLTFVCTQVCSLSSWLCLLLQNHPGLRTYSMFTEISAPCGRRIQGVHPRCIVREPQIRHLLPGRNRCVMLSTTTTSIPIHSSCNFAILSRPRLILNGVFAWKRSDKSVPQLTELLNFKLTLECHRLRFWMKFGDAEKTDSWESGFRSRGFTRAPLHPIVFLLATLSTASGLAWIWGISNSLPSNLTSEFASTRGRTLFPLEFLAHLAPCQRGALRHRNDIVLQLSLMPVSPFNQFHGRELYMSTFLITPVKTSLLSTILRRLIPFPHLHSISFPTCALSFLTQHRQALHNTSLG